MEKITAQVRVLAIDLSKNDFRIAGEDGGGKVVYEGHCKSREAFARFLKQLQPGQHVLVETGPGAQAWARQLQSSQIGVRILPAHLVRQHRAGHKNDRNDARAILRAGRDDSIHAVPIKTVEQLAIQSQHRVRRGYNRRRVAVSNEMRALLLEHGIAIARGHSALVKQVQRAVPDASVPLPYQVRDLLADLLAEFDVLGQRINRLDASLKQAAKEDPTARRLMTIPGFGPITATALACKGIQPHAYATSRHLPASIGLVPQQHSTGGKTVLGRMSRCGDSYIRCLVIQGSHSVVQKVKPAAPGTPENRLQRWLRLHGRKGAAIRLANRNLRIAWRLLRDGVDYQAQIHGAHDLGAEVEETAMN